MLCTWTSPHMEHSSPRWKWKTFWNKKTKLTYFCFLLPEWRCCRSVVSFGVWVGESGWSLRGHCSTRERRQKDRSCVQPKLQGGSGNHTQIQTSQTHLWGILVTVQPLKRLERDVWEKVTHFQSSISTGNGQRTALPFSITAPCFSYIIFSPKVWRQVHTLYEWQPLVFNPVHRRQEFNRWTRLILLWDSFRSRHTCAASKVWQYWS